MLRRCTTSVARPSPARAKKIMSGKNGVELLLERSLTVLVGGGVPLTALLIRLAEQMTRAPPPLAEPLHWLTVTPWAEAIVPVAVQVRPTRVPPLAEPLHWVIAAPVVLAGKGSQPVVIPPPEPTHWFTVAAVEPGLTPEKLVVTTTLHRLVPPPPLIESLHWVTAVTGLVRTVVLSVQAALGAPAAPWHSWTVTVADPPPAVIVLTTVTWQIRPSPPVLLTPLLHVVVAAMVVAAAAGEVIIRVAGTRSAR